MKYYKVQTHMLTWFTYKEDDNGFLWVYDPDDEIAWVRSYFESVQELREHSEFYQLNYKIEETLWEGI